jgi:hypothetical protein
MVAHLSQRDGAANEKGLSLTESRGRTASEQYCAYITLFRGIFRGIAGGWQNRDTVRPSAITRMSPSTFPIVSATFLRQ